MARSGFAAKGLYVMDGSKRSAHANAYFTGLGTAKRVVFFDTLLGKLAPGEVEAVLAHELGHFKHRHVTKRIALMFALSFAGFALLGWLSTRTWFYLGLGVVPSATAPNDAVALLLFLLVTPTFGFFFSPLMAACRGATNLKPTPTPVLMPTAATSRRRSSSCTRTMRRR
jgi:STE24 endopeptidase